MSKNTDNAIKQQNGKKAKLYTEEIVKKCKFAEILEKNGDLSKNPIEKAIYDLKIKTNQHDNVNIIISSSNSLRNDRLDVANSRMNRIKKRYDEKKQKCLCIITSNCESELNTGDDHKLFNAYNFGERDDVGIDLLIKTDDLKEVLQSIHQVKEKNNVIDMIQAGKECIEKKNY